MTDHETWVRLVTPGIKTDSVIYKQTPLQEGSSEQSILCPQLWPCWSGMTKESLCWISYP